MQIRAAEPVGAASWGYAIFRALADVLLDEHVRGIISFITADPGRFPATASHRLHRTARH